MRKSAAAEINVTGSMACTPKSMELSRRVSPAAPAMPKKIPASADAEGHREHDSGGKARTPGEHSGGEAEVLQQCAEKARFTHRRLFPASKAIFTSLYL